MKSANMKHYICQLTNIKFLKNGIRSQVVLTRLNILLLRLVVF
jgi:hypothetical protein